MRRHPKAHQIGAVIPTEAGEAPDPTFDRAAHRERDVVARLIMRLERFRRVVTRHEKRVANDRAMATAAILLWP